MIVHVRGDLSRLLIDSGTNLELHKKSGETAMIEASRRHQFETVQLLLDKGAKIDVVDHDG